MRRASILVVAALLAGCTGSAKAAFRPTLAWGGCPSAVDVQYVSRHRCGSLTVLQDPAHQDRGTIRLFILESWPTGGSPRPGLVVRLGSNLGQPADYGDSGSLATRVGHLVIDIEVRGTGFSQPSLACPEVNRLGPVDGELPSDGSSVRSRFLAAVKACHDRLVRQGIDLAQFDVAAAAHDVEDLRTALGVQRWWAVASYGTSSLYLFEYLREFPGSARAAWADSPQFPQTDEVTGGAGDTRGALAQLLAACAADESCQRAFPHLAAEWSRALTDLGRHPIHAAAKTPAGRTVRITLDAPKLLRALRYTLAYDGPAVLGNAPAMISAAARGKVARGLGATLAAYPPYCVGYLPECFATTQSGTSTFSLGTYLTVFCRDEAPFIDPVALTNAIGADAAYRSVFAQDPYLAACREWNVPPAPASVHMPPSSSVPLLIMTGQFDPYGQPDSTRVRAATLPDAWVLSFDGQTHNVLGFNDCPISIRNAWVSTLQSATTGTSCIGTMPTITFTTAAG